MHVCPDLATKFVLTTLPRRMTKKQIVRIFKERWRTERAYEELKGELGLDHLSPITAFRDRMTS